MYRTPYAGHHRKPDGTHRTSLCAGYVYRRLMVPPHVSRASDIRPTVSDITSSDHPLTLTPEFGLGVTPGARLTRVASLCVGILLNHWPEGTNNDRSPSLQDQILNHITSLEDLIKEHNEKAGMPITPIRLKFDDEGERQRKRADGRNGQIPQEAIQGGAANQGEWEMPVYCRMFQQGMTVTEMLKRVDDFVKSEEAYKSTELPKREHSERGQETPYRGTRLPCIMQGGGSSIMNEYNTYNRRDHYQPYVSPRQPGQRYDNKRFKNQRQEVNQLGLEASVKRSKKILAIELQLQLPPCPPVIRTLKKENLDRYYDYHGEKGHYNNDYYQVKRQLEAVLESGKLNHLVKDVRQRGSNRGRQMGSNNTNVQARLTQTQTELVGFSGEQLLPMGKIELEVMFGSGGLCRRTTMKFTVVQASSPYNIILGRTEMRELRAISCTTHAMIKFQPLRESPYCVSEAIGKLVKGQPRRVRLATLRHGRGTKANHPTLFECKCEHHFGGIKAKNSWFRKKQSNDERSRRIGQGRYEAVMDFPFKCFLDAYKGYHQIQMSPEDEEKTTFYTDQGTYCYTKMSFGLNNARATYQRLVDLAFQTQLGRNLEAYVDDMVIKSKTKREMIMDIAETFGNLRKAVADMQSTKTLKEMQSLSGKLVALNHFLSKSAKRELPFFETLKNITKENKDDFRWINEAEQAFQEMNRLIMELPTLTTPGLKETLYVYLAISKDEVSGVLMADRGGQQTHIRLKGAGAGLVLIDPTGTEYTYAIRLNFASTNNEAEYEALLAGLWIAEKIKVRALKVKVDSKLVACQLNGEFMTNIEGMTKYLAKAKELSILFRKLLIENVP
nr:reverse transcriptase domain-containing protein [Tanacetum cinerariifolium]